MGISFPFIFPEPSETERVRGAGQSENYILTDLLRYFRERVLNATSGSLQELNVQGLQPGSDYEFRVVAHNQHGIGESSQPLEVSTILLLCR